MRLQLILPQVNATAFRKLSVCPHEVCQDRHFEHHEEVDKPLKDTKYRAVVAHRYLCPMPPYSLTSISQQRHTVLTKDLRRASLPTDSQRDHGCKRLWHQSPSNLRRACTRFGIVLECTKCNL
jgi:hypothetical protein